MSISRINASLASANNENNLALATINFDFALIKVEPPREFKPLGMALSKMRREQAEEGIHHQTARKLGALFRSLIPSTPFLLKAYGERVSEISQIESVNPRASAGSAGIFEERIGID